MKENKTLNREVPFSWFGRLKLSKNLFPPGFSTALMPPESKSLSLFLCVEINKLTLNFIHKSKGTRITKVVLKNNKVGRPALPVPSCEV